MLRALCPHLLLACMCILCMQAWPWHPAVYSALGMVHEGAGQPEQAVDCYNTALALEPQHAPPLLRLGE